MKKVVANGLVIVTTIIFVSMVYPALLDRYGDNLSIIRKLINVVIVLDLIKYTNDRITEFGFGIYKYYKLLGMREAYIIFEYVKNHYFRYVIYICLFFASVYAGDILSALLCSIQFTVYCSCFILFLYVLLHEYKLKKQVFIIGIIIFIVSIVNIVLYLFDSMKSDIYFLEILSGIFDSVPMKAYEHIFFSRSIYNIMTMALVILFCVRKVYLLDDYSVIEDNTQKRINESGINMIMLDSKCHGLFRDIKIAFRYKESLFSYALVFGIYVFCCFLISDNRNMLFWLSFLCSILINYGLETVYLNDSNAFKVYKLFGESFDDFICRKIRISLFINIIFASVYITGFVSSAHICICILMIIIQFINILYWNMYYSYVYIGIKRYSTLLDDVKKFVVMIIGLVPFINIIFMMLYYTKGKRRWDYYVNNGEGYKTI